MSAQTLARLACCVGSTYILSMMFAAPQAWADANEEQFLDDIQYVNTEAGGTIPGDRAFWLQAGHQVCAETAPMVRGGTSFDIAHDIVIDVMIRHGWNRLDAVAFSTWAHYHLCPELIPEDYKQ